MTATVTLDVSRLRDTLRRHPWVYRGAVTRIDGSYENGDLVRAVSKEGAFVAHGFVNDRSRLFLRLVSFREDEAVDEPFFRRRARVAADLRERVLRLPERAAAYRVIHSEGDGLPGLIVDRLGDVLVLTCTSLGMSRFQGPILDELEDIYRPQAVLELGRTHGLREKEGLAAGRGVIRGKLPDGERTVLVDGTTLVAPLGTGQKTGLFLDQRENVARVAELARGRAVLDACCYGGAFGIAALRSGATSAVFFDSSEQAVAMTRRNLELNRVSDRGTVTRADLHPELRRLLAGGQRFGLVVLDPPSFAKARRDLPRARKGTVDANASALRLLEPGGLLATCSCSHHVSEPLFEEILRQAAAVAERDVQVLERRGAGPDHPTDVMGPEGRYLKCFIARVRDG
jgi:23S rRNA (cytosine1962-C5)-methyltransferase